MKKILKTIPFDTLLLMLCITILVIGIGLNKQNELKLKGEWYDKGYRAGLQGVVCLTGTESEVLNVNRSRR